MWKENNYDRIAKWDGEVKLFRETDQTNQQIEESVHDRPLNVVTKLGEPWIMANGTEHVGFVIDLLNKIAEKKNFKYNLSFVDSYGVRDEKTNEWNGLIRELIDGVSERIYKIYTLKLEHSNFPHFLHDTHARIW